MFGNTALKTGEVSESLAEAATTRHTELLRLPCGGYIADTPGFSSLETGGDYEFKEKLISCFPDLYEYSGGCRFTSCTHTCEKGCGVIAAAENGEIQKSRLESYKALFEELKDIKPWQAKR
ncbi:MAG: GTPase RsgA [Oscillospiraceae bacterium]